MNIVGASNRSNAITSIATSGGRIDTSGAISSGNNVNILDGDGFIKYVLSLFTSNEESIVVLFIVIKLMRTK